MKSKYRTTSILAAVISIIGMSPTLKAASHAVSFSLPQSPAFSGSFVNGMDGFDFTPNVDLTVSALGWYDHNGDGFIRSHPVGIYVTSTQALVAPAASILGTSDLDITTNFRYEAVVPFVLTAGTTYTLVGYGEGPVWDDYVNNPTGGVTFGPGVDFVRARSGSGSGLAFPTAASQVGIVQDLYFGANFRYTAVPEPHIVGLLGLSVLVSFRSRRRIATSQTI